MDAQQKPAVVCRDIKKHYGEGVARVDALRGVNLEVERGKLNLFMGPSGSGKTTLISVIAGILTQDSGECLLFNVDTAQLPEHEKTCYRAQHVGFVFQTFNLIPMLTNEENISVPMLLNGTEHLAALEKAKHVMNELGLGDKIGLYPSQLSGGQQQRVAIGRALVHEPPLIVCDEPTSFLDHHTGQKIMELLRQTVIEKQVTVIVVTHDPRVVPFADKIFEIEDGMATEKK
jgi:putative ABC transport system ATP-binding protein